MRERVRARRCVEGGSGEERQTKRRANQGETLPPPPNNNNDDDDDEKKELLDTQQRSRQVAHSQRDAQHQEAKQMNHGAQGKQCWSLRRKKGGVRVCGWWGENRGRDDDDEGKRRGWRAARSRKNKEKVRPGRDEREDILHLP